MDAAADNLSISVTSTPAVRTNGIFDIVVVVTNHGSHDIASPVVTVSTNPDIILETINGGTSQLGVISLLAIASDGPAGVLRPGQSSILRLYGHAPPIETTISVTAGFLTDDGTPVDWDGILAAYGGDSDSDPWNTIKDTLVDVYGTTWTSYQAALSAQATLESIFGIRDSAVLELLETTIFEELVRLDNLSETDSPTPTMATVTSTGLPTNSTEAENQAEDDNLLYQFLENGAVSVAFGWLTYGWPTAARHLNAWYQPLGPGGGTPSSFIYPHGDPVSQQPGK
jgi:hypothetical protein